jgi:hypothetical protein
MKNHLYPYQCQRDQNAITIKQNPFEEETLEHELALRIARIVQTQIDEETIRLWGPLL